MSKDSMAVLNQRKSNPNDEEDENHNNTPRLGQDSGLIQPQTDQISAPQGATAMPQPQFTGQVHNQSVVEDNEGYDHTFGPNHTFGPFAANKNFSCNPYQTFGLQVQNPNQTFGPQSQNLGHNPNQTFGPQVQNPNQTFGPQSQNLGYNPNRTFGPHASSQNVSQNPNQTFDLHVPNQNVSQNPNQTFGPHGQIHIYEYKHGDQHGDSCSSCPPSDTSSNIIWEEPVACPEACTTVEKDETIENLIFLYNFNKDVPNRLRVLKIIEGEMLKNEAMAKFLIREDFCQALDEDIDKLVKISLNSDKHDPKTEECLIYDRKLQARIKKAALGQNKEDMVRKIFRKIDRNLSLLARVYGDAIIEGTT